jgi:hypothetical protein
MPILLGMGSHDLNDAEVFKPILQAMSKPPRVIRQMDLEKSLVEFSPDALETSELLDALIAGLKNKLDEFTLGDVLHHAEKLKVALEEVSNKEAIDWLCSRESREVE